MSRTCGRERACERRLLQLQSIHSERGGGGRGIGDSGGNRQHVQKEDFSTKTHKKRITKKNGRNELCKKGKEVYFFPEGKKKRRRRCFPSIINWPKRRRQARNRNPGRTA